MNLTQPEGGTIVHQSQLAISEIKNFIKRRRIILFLTPILLVSLSVAALEYIPPKYESSITILVERDEILNPMIQYTMAVAMASEDRLRSFNEIIYSRSTINKLIDELNLYNDPEVSRENLIERVRNDIRTDLRASDSFSISYLNHDPELSQKGVELLSDHFIQTRISLENRRNEQTVEFFETKLESLQDAVNEREMRLLSQINEDEERVVREDRSIQTDLDRVELEISEINRRAGRTERSLNLIREVNQGNREIEALRELDLEQLPSGSEMQENLNEYRHYSQRYTSQYPRIRILADRIHDLSERMISEIEAEFFNQQQELTYLQNERNELISQLDQVAVSQQSRSGIRSDYEVYHTMLEEMKVKVEQARSTRELSDRAQQQFIVIDSANLPEKPAKPNRTLMIAGGLLIGIFLGVTGAGVAELLDSTIRKAEDLEEFGMPIIAYLPSGKH